MSWEAVTKQKRRARCLSLMTFIVAGLLFVGPVTPRAVNISNTWILPEEGFPVFYRYFKDRISWYEADAVCQFHHANLVTVDTTAQYDATRAYLKELDIVNNVWIGLTKKPNSPYTWTERREYRPMTGEGYWGEPLPHQLTTPLCAATDPAADFRWRAHHCGGPDVASFICELPVPSWANVPDGGCMLTSLPSLTVLYLPEQAAVELTSDCGLGGTKSIVCKGEADRDEMIRQLSCGIMPEDFDEQRSVSKSSGSSAIAQSSTEPFESATNHPNIILSSVTGSSVNTHVSASTKPWLWSSNTVDTEGFDAPTRHRRGTELTDVPVTTVDITTSTTVLSVIQADQAYDEESQPRKFAEELRLEVEKDEETKLQDRKFESAFNARNSEENMPLEVLQKGNINEDIRFEETKSTNSEIINETNGAFSLEVKKNKEIENNDKVFSETQIRDVMPFEVQTSENFQFQTQPSEKLFLENINQKSEEDQKNGDVKTNLKFNNKPLEILENIKIPVKILQSENNENGESISEILGIEEFKKEILPVTVTPLIKEQKLKKIQMKSEKNIRVPLTMVNVEKENNNEHIQDTNIEKNVEKLSEEIPVDIITNKELPLIIQKHGQLIKQHIIENKPEEEHTTIKNFQTNEGKNEDIKLDSVTDADQLNQENKNINSTSFEESHVGKRKIEKYDFKESKDGEVIPEFESNLQRQKTDDLLVINPVEQLLTNNTSKYELKLQNIQQFQSDLKSEDILNSENVELISTLGNDNDKFTIQKEEVSTLNPNQKINFEQSEITASSVVSETTSENLSESSSVVNSTIKSSTTATSTVDSSQDTAFISNEYLQKDAADLAAIINQGQLFGSVENVSDFTTDANNWTESTQQKSEIASLPSNSEIKITHGEILQPKYLSTTKPNIESSKIVTENVKLLDLDTNFTMSQKENATKFSEFDNSFTIAAQEHEHKIIEINIFDKKSKNSLPLKLSITTKVKKSPSNFDYRGNRSTSVKKQEAIYPSDETVKIITINETLNNGTHDDVIIIDPKINTLNLNLTTRNNESETIPPNIKWPTVNQNAENIMSELEIPEKIKEMVTETEKTQEENIRKEFLPSSLRGIPNAPNGKNTDIDQNEKNNGEDQEIVEETTEFTEFEPEIPPRPNRGRLLTRSPQHHKYYPYFFSRVLG